MRRHRASLIILRGRPRRRPFRLRTISASDRVRDQRLEDLERAYDRLMRLQGEWLSTILQGNVDRARVVGVEEKYRFLEKQAELNREEIAGIRAREIAGWTAKDKRMHWDLSNQNAEEIWHARHRIDAVEWSEALAFSILRKLIAAYTKRSRAVGDADER